MAKISMIFEDVHGQADHDLSFKVTSEDEPDLEADMTAAEQMAFFVLEFLAKHFPAIEEQVGERMKQALIMTERGVGQA